MSTVIAEPPADKVNYHLTLPKRVLRLADEQLPPGVTLLVCAPTDLQPEFIRLPGQAQGERCPVTGLSRSSLLTLLSQAGAKIKTRMIRQKGATKGITLIGRQSLIDYIDSQPARDVSIEEEKEDS